MGIMKYKEKKANIAQVKEQLSSYITMAQKGEKVIVCKHNRPVVELVPVDSAEQAVNRTTLGSAPGSVQVQCDLTEPAMDEDWAMHE